MRISDWSSDVCSSDLIGPRRLNDFSGNAFYRLTGARLGVQASGEVHKLNYLRSLDDERDYTSYRGALRGFYRMSPLINLYVQGYVNRRDFRQAADDAGVNRDASTFGGTVGAERSDEHTSELQSLMRISYAVFCLK